MSSQDYQRYAIGSTIGDDLIVIDILSEVPERHPIYLVWDKRAWCTAACKVFRNSRKARQEHDILSALSHPNIVRSLGTYEPAIMLTEYLYGPTFDALARKKPDGRLGIQDTIRAIIHVGAALEHVHNRGWAHLDVKPSNIALVYGRPVLFDFGAARAFGATRPPVVVGTDPYMAPEECLLGEVSPASDVFSIGVTMFELLTGALPFAELAQGIYPQTLEKPSPVRHYRPRIPARLAALVEQCLERDPARRPLLKQLLPELNGFLKPGGRMWPNEVQLGEIGDQPPLRPLGIALAA